MADGSQDIISKAPLAHRSNGVRAKTSSLIAISSTRKQVAASLIGAA